MSLGEDPALVVGSGAGTNRHSPDLHCTAGTTNEDKEINMWRLMAFGIGTVGSSFSCDFIFGYALLTYWLLVTI